MATLTRPYTFSSSEYAVAAQVNADFDTVYNWINGGGAMWNDGSVAFTQVPSGPNADPSAPNHLTRKSYVDAKAAPANLVKSANPVSGVLQVQGGTVVITTNSGGFGTVTYPNAFPTALMAVVCCEGDWSGTTPVDLSVVSGGAANGFNFHADYNNGSLANSAVRVNWIALGY